MATRHPDPMERAIHVQHAMGRLLEESFIRPRGFPLHGSGLLDVPIDLYDAGDAYLLRALVPGARPDDVQVTVLGQTVQIKGQIEMHQADPRQDVSWLVHEIPHGNFTRTVSLPQRVDADGATAAFDAGILTLRLPKAADVRPRQIKITSTGR